MVTGTKHKISKRSTVKLVMSQKGHGKYNQRTKMSLVKIVIGQKGHGSKRSWFKKSQKVHRSNMSLGLNWLKIITNVKGQKVIIS